MKWVKIERAVVNSISLEVFYITYLFFISFSTENCETETNDDYKQTTTNDNCKWQNRIR